MRIPVRVIINDMAYTFHKSIYLLSVITCMVTSSVAQEGDHSLTVGARLQKTHNLYWENGVSAEYTHSKLWDKRIIVGFHYCSSRFGSAIHSRAIKQDNYLVSLGLNIMKNTLFSPIVRVNGGYFHADIEEALFADLPKSSPLLSLEGGLQCKPKYPIGLTATLGYNLITGDGLNGPGTLYPLYTQLSIFYVIMK